MSIKHVSAKENHYDYAADKYDAIYEKHKEINDQVIANILKKNKVRTILDLGNTRCFRALKNNIQAECLYLKHELTYEKESTKL